MQLRLPRSYTVEIVPGMGNDIVRSLGHGHASAGGCDCHYFKALKDGADSYPIVFSGRDVARQGVIIIPPIEVIAGFRYAVIHSPLSELSISAGTVDGFIFRTMERKFQKNQGGWLDQYFKLKVESHYSTMSGSYEIHDLRVKIMDKNLQRFDIEDLFGNAKITTA